MAMTLSPANEAWLKNILANPPAQEFQTHDYGEGDVRTFPTNRTITLPSGARFILTPEGALYRPGGGDTQDVYVGQFPDYLRGALYDEEHPENLVTVPGSGSGLSQFGDAMNRFTGNHGTQLVNAGFGAVAGAGIGSLLGAGAAAGGAAEGAAAGGAAEGIGAGTAAGSEALAGIPLIGAATGPSEVGIGLPLAEEAGGSAGTGLSGGADVSGGAFGNYVVDPNTGDVGLPGQTVSDPYFSTNPSTGDLGGNYDPVSGMPTNNPPSNLPPGVQQLINRLSGGSGSAGASGGNDLLSGIGNNPILAAALLAGILEKPNNPLTQPTVDAIKAAIASGQSIQGLQIPGITPSFQKAIDLASSNAGAWKPYVDESAGFTRAGAAPIGSADIARYMNPYVEQALNPAARRISEAAKTQRMVDAAKSGARGAFGTERSDMMSKLGERNELLSLGDLYGTGFKSAFDTALSTAGADKARQMQAGGAFNTLGTTVSGLGSKDIEGLTTAGGIEALPYTEQLNKLKTSGDVLTGAGAAGARAIGSTGQPSLLSNLTGAAGILSTLGGTKPTSGTGSIPKLPNLNIPSLPSGGAFNSPEPPSNDPFANQAYL